MGFTSVLYSIKQSIDDFNVPSMNSKSVQSSGQMGFTSVLYSIKQSIDDFNVPSMNSKSVQSSGQMGFTSVLYSIKQSIDDFNVPSMNSKSVQSSGQMGFVSGLYSIKQSIDDLNVLNMISKSFLCWNFAFHFFHLCIPQCITFIFPISESVIASSSNADIHVVQAGDTAYNIALKNGLTLAELRTLNPTKGTMEMIHSGDRIVIRRANTAPSTTASTTTAPGKFHTVQAGDTAYNIALKNGMTLAELRRLNPGKGAMEMIHPGDRIALA